MVAQAAARIAAARTSSPTPASKTAKFFSNRPISSLAIRSYAALSDHDFARVQHLGRHAGHLLGNGEAEEPLLAEPCPRQTAVQRGTQQSTRVANAHALSDAVLPTAPARC